MPSNEISTRERLIAKLELDTALLALAASESGILTGAATLAAAAAGVPALVGALVVGGFTIAAAIAPDEMAPEIKDLEELSPYFSLPVIGMMPISPFFSPKDDPMKLARVVGEISEIAESPKNLRALGSAIIRAQSSSEDINRDLPSLIKYWTGQQPSNAKTASSPTPSQRLARETGHDVGLRQFSGKEPSPVKDTGTKEVKGGSTGMTQEGFDRLVGDKLKKETDRRPGEPDRDDKTLLKNESKDSSRPAPKPAAERRLSSDQPGHEHSFSFDGKGEHLAGAGEGGDHGAGHIA